MAQEPAYRIMLVEDEAKIAAILQAELERYGYRVVQARDFGRVKEEFIQHQPHLVVLDINLPRYDGYYWCRQIRTVSKVPIIFISARGDDVDQVRALESGGDDYITKPFSLELAVAKVNSSIRRAYGEYALAADAARPAPAVVGDLVLDPAANRVSRGGASIELAPREFQLLWTLARRAGRIVTREELLEALWDDVDFVDDNTLTVNVARLRRRLEELGLGAAIETKRGQGYLFNPAAGPDRTREGSAAGRER
ncbi:MAG: response regulator transcription factor [Bacillota bacterium]|nr:DNA-binding response regulator [Bacillota bacterium]REJ37175.1 MAG: DNA-binding response regulator [Bacillota bacterium]